MRTTLGAAVLVAVLMPGCLDGDGGGTALNARPEAESAALIRDDTAQLVGVFALATLDLASAEAFANNTTLPTGAFIDENIGDGRPHVWFFAFRGANRTHGVVVGVTDGGVLQKTEAVPLETVAAALNTTELRAVEGWLVDSDQAVKLVRERVPEWRRHMDHDLVRVWYTLRPEANATVWEVRVDHGPAHPLVHGTVDATTGEVLGVVVRD